MLAARQHQGIDHPLARDRRPADALELGIEKADIEAGIVDHQRRVAEKSDQIVGDLGEEQLVLEEFLAQAVNRHRLGRHAALGIEIAMKSLARRYAVDQLDAADLDQAMALERIKPRRFGIEHDFAHDFPSMELFGRPTRREAYELLRAVAHSSDSLQNVAHLRAGMIVAL